MKIKISGLFILGMLLVFLQVTNTIDWSWWLVCSPFILESVVVLSGIVLIHLWGPDRIEKIIKSIEDRKR